jgi:membrane fusion protein, multidrug efflux system
VVEVLAVNAHVKSADLGPAREFVEQDAAAAGKPARKIVAKRVLLSIAALAVVAFAGEYGWRYWTVGRFEEATDDAYVKADASVVAPKVSGYLRDVLVVDNQPVKAGQVLARIDDRDYEVARQQAKADVATAEADIAGTEASLDQQAANITQARAIVALDKANLVFARQENDRYASLVDRGAGTLQAAQQAVSRLAIATATLERDEAAVHSAEKQITKLNAERTRAQAVLARASAVARQAELNLDYATVRAPIDGVVGNRMLRVGQYVQAGTQLMAVVPLAATYIVANFKETQLTRVRPGQPATVVVDTFAGTALHGHVESIAPASGQEFALLPPDNATGNFTKIVQRIPVRITLDLGDALDGLLRPGMSVDATIDVKDNHEPAPLASMTTPGRTAVQQGS